MKPSKQIHDAMQAFYSGTTTPQQVKILDAWLREDPDHVRLFVDLALLDGLMLSVQKGEDAAAVLATLAETEEDAEPDFSLLFPPSFKDPPTQPGDRPLTFTEGCKLAGYAVKLALRTRAGMVSAIAALLVLSAALYLTIFGIGSTPSVPDIADNTPTNPAESAPSIQRESPGTTPGTTPVATLTASRNAQWAERALARGSELRAGQRLTLTAGFAEITTHRGAIAIVQAPATIELLDNDNAVYLHAGKLVGICETESSKGFVVKTDHADITDLGTEFGVQVTGEQVSATVFTGTINVTPPGGEPQRLTTNQTARLIVDGNNRELVIEGQIADGYDPIREQQAALAMKRQGTGVGLAKDAKAPNCRITAINGKALETPLPLHVANALPKGEIDVLAPAQMLKYYPTDGGADTIYQIEMTLRLPDRIDLDREQVMMRFRADNLLLSLKINGQSVQVPQQRTTGYGQDYRMPIDAALRPGDNHIVFEIRNQGVNTPENPVGIQVVWHWQPRAAQDKEQTP